MKNTFVFFLTLSTLFACAQADKNSMKGQEKAEYLKLVYSKCPSADILEIQQKEDYVEVEYMCEGIYYEMGVSNGKILFQETEAPDDEVLFSKIQRKLEKKYEGWLLDEITLISTEDTSFLKVEVLKDGLEQNLFFTMEGKWYKSNSSSLAVSDKWSFKNLSDNYLFKNTTYSLLKPDNSYELPEVLREISGLTVNNMSSVYCIQDELGAIFQYNYDTEQLEKLNRFTDIGDFEAVTTKGDTMYALRSDGMLFSFDKNRKVIKQTMIAQGEYNYESFTYVKATGDFLFVSKDAAIDQLESKRVVYRIKNNDFSDVKSYFTIDILAINKVLKEALPNFESNDFLFNPSDIAVHPISKEIYVLSASDRILAVFKEGKLKNVFPLPAEKYYKPEGITFYDNGDMLISNEGDKRGFVKGNIHFFKYSK